MMTEKEILDAIRPQPEEYYPTPWRIAEGKTTVVVCAEGNYTCEASSPITAQIIVEAVNGLAGLANGV